MTSEKMSFTQSLGQLAPAAEELLRGLRASGFRGWSALGLEAARTAIFDIKALAGPPEPVLRVQEVQMPGSGPVQISGTLYVPDSPTPPPVMVYLHGGGWVLGSNTVVDSIARELANRSGYAVLSVDYRLAPEHKYPAGLDDVHQALLWIAGNASRLGLDARSLAVGGDSSGANLAAAVSLRCRDQGGPALAFQLLVYPLLDRNFDTESYRSYGDGSLSALSLADVTWFLDHYVNVPHELDLPLVYPLRTSDLSRLPRTLLICAEIDPLRDDSVEYARRLEQAGVPVELRVYQGMFHGFWRAAGVLPEAREAIDHAARRMREARENE